VARIAPAGTSGPIAGPIIHKQVTPMANQRKTGSSRAHEPHLRVSIWRRYGYFWVTMILFLGSLAGHWTFAWFSFVSEQTAHGMPIEFADYAMQTARDMFENWQSEFLQLIWQVAGLAYLWHLGSPQSKEGDDRKEEKLDRILAAVDKDAERIISDLDHKYPRK
jgi:hypothetical protein